MNLITQGGYLSISLHIPHSPALQRAEGLRSFLAPAHPSSNPLCPMLRLASSSSRVPAASRVLRIPVRPSPSVSASAFLLCSRCGAPQFSAGSGTECSRAGISRTRPFQTPGIACGICSQGYHWLPVHHHALHAEGKVHIPRIAGRRGVHSELFGRSPLAI